MNVHFSVRSAEVWKVEGVFEERLAGGIFAVYSAGRLAYGQVGTVQWPLSVEAPCLKPAEGSYVFAVGQKGQQKYYVVKILNDISAADVRTLETTLQRFTAFRVSNEYPIEESVSEDDDRKSRESRTDKVVAGIGKAAAYAVQGITVTAATISKSIKAGGEKYKEGTPACQDPRPVDDTTKSRVKIAKSVAGKASAIAGVAVDAVASATSTIATAIVNSMGDNDNEDGSQKGKKKEATKKIAAASFVAAVEVYEAMEKAFELVAKSAARTTTDVVEHKYGKEYGETTSDGMAAAGHSAETFLAARHLGPKAVLKSTAKKTAVTYLTGTDKSQSSGGGKDHPTTGNGK